MTENKFIFGPPKFFNRDKIEIKKDRRKVKALLNLKGLDSKYFLEAFDYFVDNPESYDGATIIKDLIDVVGLDLGALRHDYDYLYTLPKFKGIQWLKMKAIVDFNYGKNLEELGKGIFTPYSRTFLLWLSTPFYLLIKLFDND